MPSFDIVSEIDLQEARNAVENAQRELDTRFDFRGIPASFDWVKDQAVLAAESDYQCQQMLDILRSKLIKRGLDAETMEISDPEHTGKTVKIRVGFKEGIETDVAKKIIKSIKDSKLKVQASIQGEQLRITGKKRDELQSVIALVKGGDFGQPFQYKNFRD